MSNGFWQAFSWASGGDHNYADEAETAPIVRASHSAMVDAAGKMWVVGGETFAPKSHHMVATYELGDAEDDVGVGRGRWTEVQVHSNRSPSLRYAHSSVIHEDAVSEIRIVPFLRDCYHGNYTILMVHVAVVGRI